MIGIALAIVVAAAPARIQTLESPAFTAFDRATDAICPTATLRLISPADLDGRQEEFIAALSWWQRRRLAAVNRADRLCAGRNGLSCPTTATLAAFIKRGLMRDFAAAACAGGPPN